VHTRLRGIKRRLEEAAGGPRGGRRYDSDSQYFLAGFSRCGVCGGSVGVVSRQSGKERRFLYGCMVRHKRGASVCSNAVLLPMAVVNEAVLKELAVAMGDEMVWRLLNYTFDAIAPPTVAAGVERLQENLRTIDRKIANLLVAIENGGAAATLIQHLQARADRMGGAAESHRAEGGDLERGAGAGHRRRRGDGAHGRVASAADRRQ
jgi:hypothetical protein